MQSTEETVRTSESVPLRSAVEIAMAGGVRQQDVEAVPQQMGPAVDTVKTSVSVVPESSEQQPTEQQDQIPETQGVVPSTEYSAPQQKVEGLTPEESAVVARAEQLKPGWGEKAKNEINKLFDRTGVVKILEGVGNTVEGMRAKRVYKLAMREIKRDIRNQLEEVHSRQSDVEFARKSFSLDRFQVEKQLSEEKARLDALAAERRYMQGISAKDLQRIGGYSSFSPDETPKAGEDMYATPYVEKMTSGARDSLFRIGRVQHRWRLRGEDQLGPEDNVLNLLEDLSRTIQETVDKHTEDMIRLNQSKSDVIGLRGEVSA